MTLAKPALFCFALCWMVLSWLPSAQAQIEPTDATEILYNFLNMENPAHRRKAKDGSVTFDELAAYKAWAALYDKYAQIDTDKFREDYLRVYLLLGMVAKENLMAGTMEAFASDLIPLYEKHGMAVLNVFKELPFLIPSTCYYLRRYFGFEDQNAEKRPAFLVANEALFEHELMPEDKKRCWDVLIQESL